MFSQPNLVAYLREIESSLSLEKFNHSPTSMYQSQWNSCHSLRDDSFLYSSFANESCLSDKSNADQSFHLSFASRWNMIIKQKIYELEGPTFIYQYLFAAPPSKDVSRGKLKLNII